MKTLFVSEVLKRTATISERSLRAASAILPTVVHLFAVCVVGVPRTRARRKAFRRIIPCFSRFSLISFATAVPNRAKGYYKTVQLIKPFFFFARNPL
jgi:hypothetical protein